MTDLSDATPEQMAQFIESLDKIGGIDLVYRERIAALEAELAKAIEEREHWFNARKSCMDGAELLVIQRDELQRELAELRQEIAYMKSCDKEAQELAITFNDDRPALLKELAEGRRLCGEAARSLSIWVPKSTPDDTCRFCDETLIKELKAHAAGGWKGGSGEN